MQAKILEIESRDIDRWLPGLSDILHASVLDGASVGFIEPFQLRDANRFWQETITPAVTAGDRRLWIATVDDRAVGTAQLALGMPGNQQHRAEVSKMLVHPHARRKGIARALMDALIETALAENRSLITLDTRTGDPATALYQSFGFQVAGEIPFFCRAPNRDALEATTYMYKVL
ncbi:MAG: GNAT family N-acetyltransferase [Pseudomonadota bacterium]